MARLPHQEIVDKLTLEEKASLTSGANFWNTEAIERINLPSIMLTDGPHGLRKQAGKSDNLGLNKSVPATCFPTAASLANSWNEDLLSRIGEALGAEAATGAVSVLLGPGLNIIRNPLGGRSFEYFSEDPFISGKLAAALVRGIQSQNVAASPKHFAVNSQEHLRMTIDELVDEKSLHEIYLEGFRIVVEESAPKVIMTSYNKINGVYANESKNILKKTLQEKWKFDGVVVTDWGGTNDRVLGLQAGNQLEMPTTGGITDNEIVEAVKSGRLSEGVLDEAVSDIIDLIELTKKQDRLSVNLSSNHDLAVEAAGQSVVLLKNNQSILPINGSDNKIAVIGDFAARPRYQGAGSSLVNPTSLPTALEELYKSDLEIVGYVDGFKRFGGTSRRRVKQAVSLAKKADTVLLFLGLSEAAEAEGVDRQSMELPSNQLELVEELLRLDKHVVVIVSGGSPVELAFADRVDAILHGQLSGQGGSEALVKILKGEINPSGKLAQSYPYEYGDVPSADYYPGKELTAEHREAIYIGYRYYDSAGVDVRYPFGFGLSYSEFEYSQIRADQDGVSFKIRNISRIEGREVSQVYIEPKHRLGMQAKQQLKGFSTASLKPGESKHIAIKFDKHAFSDYDTNLHDWRINPGEYLIKVGASSRDIRLQHSIVIKGSGDTKSCDNIPEVYRSGQVQSATSQDFSRLLGYDLPPSRWDRGLKLTMDDTIGQLSYQNWIGKATAGLIRLFRELFLKIKRPIIGNNAMFIINLPFNKIVRLTGGKGRVTNQRIERFLRLVARRSKRN